MLPTPHLPKSFVSRSHITKVKADQLSDDNVKDHLENSPILVLQKDKKVYSVMMTPSADDSDKLVNTLLA
jgi:hypothetical protein